MARFYADGSTENQLRWSIIDALRRYGTDASKVGQVFAHRHDLHLHDLQALVAIMSAEGSGHPLTPGGLRNTLGLSSAGTSYVIDRLAKAGHVQRYRDHPSDNRIVHLRYTQEGQTLALSFFGPLGAATEAIMDGFSPRELQVIDRFMQATCTAMLNQLEQFAEDESIE
jgi:DNA-binding MarR family transcriptional regulator